MEKVLKVFVLMFENKKNGNHSMGDKK